MATGWLDSALELDTERNGAVGDSEGKVKVASVHDRPARDPVDVFRAALAERARWQKMFVAARLNRSEIESLLHTIEGARGREDFSSRDKRKAMGLLTQGRADWFECLLRMPATIPDDLRAALAALSEKHRR
jgi:hypothetical protein